MGVCCFVPLNDSQMSPKPFAVAAPTEGSRSNLLLQTKTPPQQENVPNESVFPLIDAENEAAATSCFNSNLLVFQNKSLVADRKPPHSAARKAGHKSGGRSASAAAKSLPGDSQAGLNRTPRFSF